MAATLPAVFKDLLDSNEPTHIICETCSGDEPITICGVEDNSPTIPFREVLDYCNPCYVGLVEDHADCLRHE